MLAGSTDARRPLLPLPARPEQAVSRDHAIRVVHVVQVEHGFVERFPVGVAGRSAAATFWRVVSGADRSPSAWRRPAREPAAARCRDI